MTLQGQIKGDDIFGGLCGRLLPWPSTSFNNKVLYAEVKPDEPPGTPGNMTSHGHFIKDLPISNEIPQSGQQLPPLSHLLNGQNYHDYSVVERQSLQNGHGLFCRPQYSLGNSGGGIHGPLGPYSHYTQSQSYQAHYRNRSDTQLVDLSPGPFSIASLAPDQIPHRTSIASLLSRPAGPTRSGSAATLDQPRIPPVAQERDISGRDVCFKYDEGTRFPNATEVDPINPRWGVTKAGKPRKRLAQACATCREKKIRCDPGSTLSKCSQCLKFKRECRFESQPLPGPRSRSTSTANSPAFEGRSNLSPIAHRASATSPTPPCPITPSSKTSTEIGNSTSGSPFPNQTGNDATSEQPHPFKRMKPSVFSPDSESKRTIKIELYKSAQGAEEDGIFADMSFPTRDLDPFEFDERMTDYYLDRYFTKVNCTTYCMFPKGPFMKWVRQCRNKTSWDKTLLYAMLAEGTIFATNLRRHADGQIFSEIAHRAIGESAGVFNLQVVQTRLILALYDFSQGNTSKAWDFTGATVHAACGMGLNDEDGISDMQDDQFLDYGFEKATLSECRRRTFWSAYIMDRFQGFHSGHLIMFQNEDCRLRLPCNEQMYEEENISLTPWFNSHKIDPEQFVAGDSNAQGMMAYLVQIVSIWGEVVARAYRSRYQPASAWGGPFEIFYQRTIKSLEAWERSLSVHLKYSVGNIDRAGRSGQLGTYGSLHTLYHCTKMTLNRTTRYDQMHPQHIDRNVKCAYEHAYKTLDMMKAITKQTRGGGSGNSGFAVSSPFTGFAVLMAIDILTATGSMADMVSPDSRSIELLAGGIDVMTELTAHWSSAKTQLKLIAGRFEDLMATLQCHAAPEKRRVTAFFSRHPLEATFGVENDLVYALPRKRYLEALGCGSLIQEGDEMLEVLKHGSRVNAVPVSSTRIWDS